MKRILAGAAAVLTAAGLSLGFGLTASAATCTTSSASGGCGPYYNDPAIYQDVNGSPDVAQDVWNQIPGWQQTLSASSLSSWNVSASMPQGNTAVVSYPSARVTYTLPTGATPPMSNFGQLNSTWSHASPASISGDDFEWAYDIWLNPAGQPSWGGNSGFNDQEVMIWTDVHGQRPAGNDTGKAYTDAAGVNWEIWLDKGSCSTCTADNDQIVTFARSGNAASGSVDLTGFFAYMTAAGYTTANAGIDQVNYGVELCSTGGNTQAFTVSGYTLNKGTAPAPTPTPTGTPTPTPTSTTPAPVPTGLSQTPHVNVSFGWAAVPGAASYDFSLTGPGVTVNITTTATGIPPVELKRGTAYSWRVRVTGGQWSAARGFTT